MRRFIVEVSLEATGDCRDHHGRPVHPDHRVRHGHRDCRCSNCHGYDRPNRHGHDRPSRDSDEPGSRLVATAGNNAAPVDKPAAGSNTAE